MNWVNGQETIKVRGWVVGPYPHIIHESLSLSVEVGGRTSNKYLIPRKSITKFKFMIFLKLTPLFIWYCFIFPITFVFCLNYHTQSLSIYSSIYHSDRKTNKKVLKDKFSWFPSTCIRTYFFLSPSTLIQQVCWR